MSLIHSRIADIIAKAGPPTKQELVYIGKPGEDKYQELGTFTFKRLPFKDLDALRLRFLDDKGKFNRELFAGQNARAVAATLLDDETGELAFTEEQINEWPAEMVDAFSAASDRANSMTLTAAKEVAKNSDATAGVSP